MALPWENFKIEKATHPHPPHTHTHIYTHIQTCARAGHAMNGDNTRIMYSACVLRSSRITVRFSPRRGGWITYWELLVQGKWSFNEWLTTILLQEKALIDGIMPLMLASGIHSCFTGTHGCAQSGMISFVTSIIDNLRTQLSTRESIVCWV